MENFSTALSYFQRALQIRQKSLPSNHPYLAITYNNIGGVYRSIGDCSTAISYFEKALEIQQKSLASNHPNLAMTYNNIALVYQSMEDYLTAISYYERAIEIVQHSSLPTSHPFLHIFQKNLVEVRKKH
ncbi:unnamed protein product [Rotaria sp. Silwood1]|nr:unnamed protein product [Rotaria sp. Silwood1]